jgi:hypothetical protein
MQNLDRDTLSLIFCATCRNFLCKNTGRAGPVPIFASTFWNVDSPRASKGNWNAWTWKRLKQTDVLFATGYPYYKIKAIDKQMGTQRGNRGATVLLWLVILMLVNRH